MKLSYLAAAMLVITTTVMPGNATPSIPDGGTPLLPADAIALPNIFSKSSFKGQPSATSELVSVTNHPAFNQALRVTVTNPSGVYYKSGIKFSSTAAVAKGDVILVRLYFRTISSSDETGAGFATVYSSGPAPANTKYVRQQITAFGAWKEYLIPFEVADSLSAGKLTLQIGSGGGSNPQTWEIGGIEFINYGASLTVADLPATIPAYEGREPDASWRAEADARIEQYRKGDFRIHVLDTQGNPLTNATVNVEFQRHAYHFGSAVRAARILGTTPDDTSYREKFRELFNQGSPENDLKWAQWAGERSSRYSQTNTLAALQWLKDNDISTRGHVMVWPSKSKLPKRIQSYLPSDPTTANPAAKQVVLDHIDDIASRTASVIDEWDVINEPYKNHDLMDAFGNEVMIDWFNQARANLPEIGLYLNDYGILSGGGQDLQHQQHYEDTIGYLLTNNAPITGIGMQGHFNASPTGIERIYNILERYHTRYPQLDIRVTEFDIDTDDDQVQADYTRDFLTIMFSHPATVGVQSWGFWEGSHWKPAAAMYKRDWSEKPNGTAWRQLTRETWWNDFSGTTDSNGEYTARGFYGDYLITIRHGDAYQQLRFPFRNGGPSVVEMQMNTL